jgi:hypothetical protein
MRKPIIPRKVSLELCSSKASCSAAHKLGTKTCLVDCTLQLGLLKRASFQTMMTGRLLILKELIFSESRP